MTDVEFVARDLSLRAHQGEFRVRLGDTDVTGRLRLDGLARFLQDVASDDWSEALIDEDYTWVVRRTSVRWNDETPWPAYLDQVTLVTWCGGVGPAWAERRTDVLIDGRVAIESSAIWVPIDERGAPVRLREDFFAFYGEAVRERRVSGRVEKRPVDPDAVTRPWPLRRADLDVVGHVNNAAVWAAVSEVAPAPQRRVTLNHHGALELGDEVTLAWADDSAWLVVGDVVRVSAHFEP